MVATPAALRQWQQLVDRGVGSGVLENRVLELLPRGDGDDESGSRVRAGNQGGLIFGAGWVAKFTKDRSPLGTGGASG